MVLSTAPLGRPDPALRLSPRRHQRHPPLTPSAVTTPPTRTHSPS
jgi:hypothetical protein